MPTTLRIGTRKSRLALAQAEILSRRLAMAFPDITLEIVPMMTTGDKNTDRVLADIGGKGLFTKELEEGLTSGHIDMAAHSLKDMETHLPHRFMIATVLEREDPRDALITRDKTTLKTLHEGARVGTSSLRRAAQLRLVRPDLIIVPFRGNVLTRLAKLADGEVDATLLALAGLKRIGVEREASEILDTEHFLPAAGQGTIAVECKKDNIPLVEMLASICHIPTHHAMLAERSLLATIDGSCRTPIGAYARMENGKFRLDAMIAKPDGSAHASAMREGIAEDAEAMGADAGAELLSHGGIDWFK